VAGVDGRDTSTLRRPPRRRLLATLSVLLGLAAAWAVAAGLFVLDVTEHGVVTRFGQVVRVVAEPGLHVTLPIDHVVRLERRLLYTRPEEIEFLTADKENVVVESLATWRIGDPARFLATVGTLAAAEERLADVILAEMGAALGRYSFADLASAGGEGGAWRAMVAEIGDHARAFARSAYGVEVVDVELRQLRLPEKNRQNVFVRMTAERGRMAAELRSEGERDSTVIIAKADRERARIGAEAYEQAEIAKGEGEAEAMRIYGAAFARDPGFYKLLRTLEAYEKLLDGRTTLFLPADAEVFQMLGGRLAPVEPVPRQAPPGAGEAAGIELKGPFGLDLWGNSHLPAGGARPSGGAAR
jgi:modulator of FtsH protease HflC